MRRFAALLDALERSGDDDRAQALLGYLGSAEAGDAAWAVHLLAGGRLRQAASPALLRRLALSRSGLDDWLFEACLDAVGDLAETVAHVVPPAARRAEAGLADCIEQYLLPLPDLSAEQRCERLGRALDAIDDAARLPFLQLAGGGLRARPEPALLHRALARHAGVEAWLIALRLAGWGGAARRVEAADLSRLLDPAAGPGEQGRPCAFAAARPLQGDPSALGAADDWLAEWSYDGVRAQLVRRGDGCWLWSEGGEPIGACCPEIVAAAHRLPAGTVLEGELLPWPAGDAGPSSGAALRQRLDRGRRARRGAGEPPLVLVVDDLLQRGGVDMHDRPLRERRAGLQQLLGDAMPGAAGHAALRASEPLPFGDWHRLRALHGCARQRRAAGLVLRQRSAARSGAPSSWLWLADALRIDAVLVHARAAQGGRPGASRAYMFALWSRPPRDAADARAAVERLRARSPVEAGALHLVPCATAAEGLDDAGFARLEEEVLARTVQRFGPVRSLEPRLVVELAFDGVHRQARRKSGLELRSPRLLRIRDDLALHEAGCLAALQSLHDGG